MFNLYGTIKKVLSQGAHMPNMKALSLINMPSLKVEKL